MSQTPNPSPADPAPPSRQESRADGPRASAPVAHPGLPDGSHIYLLVAGILLGVLLGPGVLGRIAPRTYERVFIGGDQARQALALAEAEFNAAARRLTEVGVTPTALAELEQQTRPRLAVMQAQVEQAQAEHGQRLAGLLTSLIVALGAMMVLEALPGPGSAARPAMLIGRYALLGVWTAGALARPTLWRSISPTVVVIAVLAVLALTLLPPGKSRQKESNA